MIKRGERGREIEQRQLNFEGFSQSYKYRGREIEKERKQRIIRVMRERERERR